MDVTITQSGNPLLNVIFSCLAILTGVTSYLIDAVGLSPMLSISTMNLEEFNLLSAVILKWVSIASILGLVILNWRKVLKKFGILKSK